MECCSRGALLGQALGPFITASPSAVSQHHVDTHWVHQAQDQGPTILSRTLNMFSCVIKSEEKNEYTIYQWSYKGYFLIFLCGERCTQIVRARDTLPAFLNNPERVWCEFIIRV